MFILMKLGEDINLYLQNLNTISQYAQSNTVFQILLTKQQKTSKKNYTATALEDLSLIWNGHLSVYIQITATFQIAMFVVQYFSIINDHLKFKKKT